MKKINLLITLFLVCFMTLYSFINMFDIVKISNQVLQIVIENLIPSLLPFMILISLCLNLGILHLLGYCLQYIGYYLFHLTPMMSSIYFVSFFCGYPTNIKMMKEAYLLGYLTIDEVDHLLTIASFSSLSFIFVSLSNPYSSIIYFCHICPSLLLALFYHHPCQKINYQTVKKALLKPHDSFVLSFKKSITSSLYAFIFILGYMLVFQFLSYSLASIIHNKSLQSLLLGIMEFSSGSLQMLKLPYSPLSLACICGFLSFSGLSVIMQCDNLLEDIPCHPYRYFLSRIYQGLLSFVLCFIFLLLIW